MKYRIWYDHKSSEYSKTLWHAESLIRREALMTTCRKPTLYRFKTDDNKVLYYLSRRDVIKDKEGRYPFACISLDK